MKSHYPLLQRIFGPNLTEGDILAIQFRALEEGWTEWLEMMLSMKNRRKRRWLLTYIRDGHILVYMEEREYDPLQDDDPFEGMG